MRKRPALNQRNQRIKAQSSVYSCVTTIASKRPTLQSQRLLACTEQSQTPSQVRSTVTRARLRLTISWLDEEANAWIFPLDKYELLLKSLKPLPISVVEIPKEVRSILKQQAPAQTEEIDFSGVPVELTKHLLNFQWLGIRFALSRQGTSESVSLHAIVKTISRKMPDSRRHGIGENNSSCCYCGLLQVRFMMSTVAARIGLTRNIAKNGHCLLQFHQGYACNGVMSFSNGFLRSKGK